MPTPADVIIDYSVRVHPDDREKLDIIFRKYIKTDIPMGQALDEIILSDRRKMIEEMSKLRYRKLSHEQEKEKGETD